MPDHYLAKLIENPHLEDPVGQAPDVHKHFTRYSKGAFEGPVFKISRTKAKITLWSSHEYEDILLRFALQLCDDDEINVTGKLLGASNFTPLMEHLNFSKAWFPVKSKGKTENFTIEFKTPETIEKQKMVDLAIKGTPYVYILLSFTSADKSVVLKIKKKPPRPSSKNPEDAAIAAKLKFASLKVPYSEELAQAVFEEVFPDFLDEIPKGWKSITIQNIYKITDLEIPKKKMNSRKIRLHTLRKGSLKRIIDIDKEEFVNEVEFSA
ncbi:MAG: hypothetical protein ACTSVZ_00995 [Promethearchaeota archaeon]